MEVEPVLPECQQCGKPYSPLRFWQRFCSVACRMAFNNERRKKAVRLLSEVEGKTVEPK